MRIWICLFVAVAALCAAEKPAATKARAKQEANRTRKVEAVVVPPGAVETEPGTWQYTDKQGRKWIYRKTPFGMARVEDKQSAEEPSSAADPKAESLEAFEDGEFVRFERKGPFGVYKWRRSKKDLNTAEQQAWDRAQASAARESGKE
ncbi:MAG TPA: hypothetical protein VN442_06480 [Bryobacteraceae bacterium]|nr:hypothetical protein [Bryobacteraceae bacterium]